MDGFLKRLRVVSLLGQLLFLADVGRVGAKSFL